eukprot:gnl/TRDRNA2_/TRDRNA2_37002_c0_seq1.p1 gnl/TRDRNA2_/TRDRNA2_37002_c0~~gnl/TRDRNA2_/TRDRNA2_37002_c0_seq1.p1  ORF type:complete len:424 (+),score=64.21 gnl/TRDRNA2_/TRDRNA2_37002_c0_seq1:105-1376(+)
MRLLLFIGCLAAAAIALRREQRRAPRTVTLALRRQTVPHPPQGQLAAVQLERNVGHGFVTLEERRHTYFGPLQISNQVLTVVFDTGSANLIVPSAECESEGCRGHHGFNTNASASGEFVSEKGDPTDHFNARHFSITFASGKASGVAFKDRICIDGQNGGSGVCANATKFLLAEWESDDFADFDFDGILGLSPNGQLSAGEGFSLLDELVRQGQLSQKMFAMYLAASSDEAGELTLGGYDEHRASGGLTWVDLIPGAGSWEVPIQDIVVNGTRRAVQLCSSGGCTAVIDSGCPDIAMPKDVALEVAGKIGFNGEKLQCTHPELALPSIGFVLGTSKFEVSPVDYVEVSPTNPESCRLRFSQLSSDVSGSRTFLLGHPFLQRHYSIYDQDGMRLGLAPIARPKSSDLGPAAAAMARMLAGASHT